MSEFHVLVAGGGIAGLCLAHGLRGAGIRCTVLESTQRIVRTGYRLHINGDGGRALQRCLPANLYELYAETSRIPPRRTLTVHLDHHGNEVGARPHFDPPNDPVRPHTAVDRRLLRQIMATGLGESLRFGCTVAEVHQDDDGVRVTLSDGRSLAGDVLVAADGINSAVRGQLMPRVEVVDTGLRGLYAIAPLDDELAALLPEGVFDGFAMATDPVGSLLACGVFQPRRPVVEAVAEHAPQAAIDPVGPYVMAGLFAAPGSDRFPDDVTLRDATPAERHALMRRTVAGWGPPLRGLVERADPLTAFPVAVRRLQEPAPWPTSRVTFLGDAAHAMPPVLGTGANTALRDAAALVERLSAVARGDVALLEAIADFEADMRDTVFPILRAASDPRAFDPEFLPEGETVPHRA